MRSIDTQRGIVDIERICNLEPGDQLVFKGIELVIMEKSDVLRFARIESGNTYEQKIGSNSQEWVEILKRVK